MVGIYRWLGSTPLQILGLQADPQRDLPGHHLAHRKLIQCLKPFVVCTVTTLKIKALTIFQKRFKHLLHEQSSLVLADYGTHFPPQPTKTECHPFQSDMVTFSCRIHEISKASSHVGRG